MGPISKKNEILQDINARLGGELQGVQALLKVGSEEIEEDGHISNQTCEAMSVLMPLAEQDARKLYTGLLSIHQSMFKYVPEGFNEGNKEWPP